MITYSGFSTYNRQRKFKITDFDLVCQDIFNHFSIRRGEKLMNPKFGTIIWDLMFEPFTDNIRDLITEDIKTVINYDPRVVADSVTVTELDHGIQIELQLRYVLINQSQAMRLQFDRNTKALTVA